uniref:uncharacterized protein LOC120339413 n=1 Tax=Styela clava TaxID=7725 RepID=UPI001939C3D5|nr:uncharacterized protein LOC120339413 [Styela clava]
MSPIVGKTPQQNTQPDAICEEPSVERVLVQGEKNVARQLTVDIKPSWRNSVMLFLLLMSNVVGGGFFVLGFAAEGIVWGSLFWQTFVPVVVSTFCMHLLLELLKVHSVDNYMDLVAKVIGSGMLFASVLFYAADIATLLSLFIIIKHKALEMLVLFGVDEEVLTGWLSSFSVVAFICVILLAMEFGRHLEKYLKKKTISINNNNVNVMGSQIDTLVAFNTPTPTGRTQALHFNKRTGVLLCLIIIYIGILFVKAFSPAQHSLSSSIDDEKNMTVNETMNLNDSDGPYMHAWRTMPIIVFAISPYVIMLRMNEQTQRLISASCRKHPASIPAVLFLPTLFLFFIMNLMSYDEKNVLPGLQIAQYIIAIIVCILAASLRLLPCAKVCERIMCRKCEEGGKWHILLYAMLLISATLFSLFVDCEECVIVLAGCTVWPIFMWILPCLIFFFHLRVIKQNGGNIRTRIVIFKGVVCCLILLGSICFCVLHLAKIGEVFYHKHTNISSDETP